MVVPFEELWSLVSGGYRALAGHVAPLSVALAAPAALWLRIVRAWIWARLLRAEGVPAGTRHKILADAARLDLAERRAGATNGSATPAASSELRPRGRS